MRIRFELLRWEIGEDLRVANKYRNNPGTDDIALEQGQTPGKEKGSMIKF